MIPRLFRRSDTGTAMVEFSILAPVFVFLLIGVIEVGRFAFFAILAANAARAGVQYGAQNTTTAIQTANIQNAALQDGQNLANWTSNGGSITVKDLCSVNGAAPATCVGTGVPVNTVYYVQVQVKGVFSSLLNYPGIPNNVPISGSAIMRVASQ